MEPCSFNESNDVLGPPKGMTEEEVQSLSVCRTRDVVGTPVVISCWKFTVEELAEVNKTGRIWLGVLGHTMPPVWLRGTNPWE